MKKIFTLCVFSLMGLVAMAQSYVFTDKEGNTIEDGATVTRMEVEDDGFGDLLISSGLYVKNVGAPTNYAVSIEAKITRMDNGALQLCFPENCQVYSATGTYEPEGKATIDKDASKDIMSEWLPTAYGECTVTYTAKAQQKMGNTYIKKGTYSVTVNYRYSDPSAIEGIAHDEQPMTAAVYDLTGRRMKTVGRLSASAIRLVRFTDGTVRKVIK